MIVCSSGPGALCMKEVTCLGENIARLARACSLRGDEMFEVVGCYCERCARQHGPRGLALRAYVELTATAPLIC